ncbi:hypothetical protein Tco_0731057, partial [Tanacetum coccineum]
MKDLDYSFGRIPELLPFIALLFGKWGPLQPNSVRFGTKRIKTVSGFVWGIPRCRFRIDGIGTGAMEWSRAANQLMENVDDDGYVIENKLPIVRPKRRLIFTTLLMQQLLRPPPSVSLKAISNYESVVYHAARLALGDACNLVSSAQSNSSIHLSDANCLSDKKEQPETTDDHRLSKVIEDFKSKAGKLEDDFFRLDKRASILDLSVDFQDLEIFSVLNRFAIFHGRGQADGTQPTADASRPSPKRYVTAVPMSENLLDM